MTKIKICGIKTLRDVDYLNELMPDYVGLVFAKSKRQISLEQAIKMRSYINKKIKVVGVFSDENIEKVIEISKLAKLDIIQLHGVEDLDYIRCIEKRSKVEIWKALCIKSCKDIKNIDNYKGYKLLIDGSSAGGGKSFDWNLINTESLCNKFILAGGLNSDNVQEGMGLFSPFAVDVSSGVESDNIKDYEKIKKFIERVRQYDKRQIR